MNSPIHFLSRLLPHFAVDKYSYDSERDGGGDIALEFGCIYLLGMPKRGWKLSRVAQWAL